GRIDEDDVGRALVGVRERGVTGGERLDRELHTFTDPRDLGRRFRTVELHTVQAGTSDDLHDPLRSLVAEHAHGVHLAWKALDDVADRLRMYLTPARREHEPEGVGIERGGKQRVVFIR